MPNRLDANIGQILGSQFGKRIAINVVPSKRLRVLLQPKTFQPGFHIHHSPPVKTADRANTVARRWYRALDAMNVRFGPESPFAERRPNDRYLICKRPLR
jgi:hypothetical protein